MSVSEVSEWITSLGFPQYKDAFIHGSVDKTVLVAMTERDLLNLGVEHPLHRKKILLNRDAKYGGTMPSEAELSVKKNILDFIMHTLYELAKSSTVESIVVAAGAIELLTNGMRDYPDELGVQQAVAASLRNLGGSSDAAGKRIVDAGGVELLIESMKKFSQDAILSKEATGALCQLAKDDTISAHMAQSGVPEMILRCMKAHEDNGVMQRLGAAALCNMSRTEENKTKIINEGGVLCLVTALKVHSTNAAVQRAVADAIHNLALVNDTTKASFGENGAIELLAESMRKHGDVPALQEACARALRNLASNVASNRTAIVRAGVTDLLLKTMRSHNEAPAVQAATISALGYMAFHNAETRAPAIEGGAITLLLDSMKLHGSNAQLQEAGARALCNLVFNDDDTKNVANEGGALQLLLKALKAHQDDPAVVAAVCDALCNLSRSDEMKQVVVDLDGIAILLSAIRAHSRKASVLTAVGRVLCNLANCTDSVVRMLIEAGTVELLISGARTFSNSASAVDAVCSTLRNLSYRSADVRHRLIESDAQVLFVKAMGVHTEVDSVQKSCAGALRCLMMDDEYIPFVKAAHAVDALVAALKNFNHSVAVLEPVLSSMACLCAAADEEMKGLLVTTEIIDILLAVMGAFESSAEVQKNCGTMMGTIAGEKEDIDFYLVEKGAVELLTAAMQEHATNHLVHEACASALLGLTHGQVDMATRVTKAMRTHSSSGNLQRTAANAVKKLVERDGQKSVLDSGAVEVLTEAMQAHGAEPEIQEAVAEALQDIAGGGEAGVSRAVESNAVGLLLQSLGAHSQHAGVAKASGGALAKLCHDSTDVADQIVAADGVEILTASLKEHGENAEVVAPLADALSIITVSEGSCERGQDCALPLAAVTVLRDHGGVREVQLPTIKLIGNLATCTDAKKAMLTLDTVGLIMRYFTANVDDAEVSIICGTALRNIARGTEEARRSIVTHNGVELLLSAVNKHMEEQEVCEALTMAVCHLTIGKGDGRKARIVSANALPILTDAFKRYLENANIVKAVATAFCNLSSRNEAVKARILHTEAVAIMAAAVDTHLSDASVQESIVGLMRNLSSGKEEFKIAMVTNEAVQLVLKIIVEHPMNGLILQAAARMLRSLAISTNRDIKAYCVEAGAIDVLKRVLPENSTNSKVTDMILECIHNLEPDGPLAPRITGSKAFGPNRISVWWEKQDGVAKWQLEARAAGSQIKRFECDGELRSLAATGLIPDTEYSLRVRGFDAAGWGAWAPFIVQRTLYGSMRTMTANSSFRSPRTRPSHVTQELEDEAGVATSSVALMDMVAEVEEEEELEEEGEGRGV